MSNYPTPRQTALGLGGHHHPSRCRGALASDARANGEWALARFQCPNPSESSRIQRYLGVESMAGEQTQSQQPYGFAVMKGRTHDPLAMQKVVGSSPIIRLKAKPWKRGFSVA